MDAPQELPKAEDGRESEILTNLEKLKIKVQKITQEKTSLEMELKYKEQQYQTLLSAKEKDEVYNQFLQIKLNKKKEKIKRLKEELGKKKHEFQPAHEEAQILQKELLLLEPKKHKPMKHKEVKQLQRKEKLACSDHQFSEPSQITVANVREMKETSLYDSLLIPTMPIMLLQN